MQYVDRAARRNFGTMLSMAGVTPLIRFLTLLPKHILIGFLTEPPEMTIATDGVAPELTDTPRRWDDRDIRVYSTV